MGRTRLHRLHGFGEQCVRLEGIENKWHWTLDMALDEDYCRAHKVHGPKNFALNLFTQEKTCQRSIKGKRPLAGWNPAYLLKVHAGCVWMGCEDAFALYNGCITYVIGRLFGENAAYPESVSLIVRS
jgi:hypothetical protein